MNKRRAKREVAAWILAAWQDLTDELERRGDDGALNDARAARIKADLEDPPELQT